MLTRICFSGTYTNLGGGLDPKSGIFVTPVAGSYLFQIHVCTLDHHKALLSIRLNGKEVACFYDQVLTFFTMTVVQNCHMNISELPF